jgi:DNA-binding MurR/RpiR family transcriptional regulator
MSHASSVHVVQGTAATHSGVLSRIRAAYSSLSGAERRVAALVLADPRAALVWSVETLAARCGASTATVVRFCRTLGYRGLRDFRLALAAEAKGSPRQELHESIEEGDSVLVIAQKVLASDLQAIEDTRQVLDADALQRAVDALAHAEQIVFFGVGSSLPIAMDAFYRFLRLGSPVSLVSDPHMQAVTAAQLTPGSVAFAISHTGRTRETLDALRKAKQAGATCILLTSHRETPLGQIADIELVTVCRETRFRTEAMASRIAHLSLIDTLYVAVGMRRGEAAHAALARADAIVAEHRLPPSTRLRRVSESPAGRETTPAAR